jgi:hypothetical protein
VSFYGAKIDGQFYCLDGTFSSQGQDALILRLASVGGEAEFRSIVSDGYLDLRGAKISGDLIVDSAVFQGTKEDGLRAKGLTVGHAFYWTNIKNSAKTHVDLSYASVGVLDDDRVSWPQPGFLLIEGFTYSIIRGNADDATTRLEWLRRQPFPLTPQPYSELAKVFHENGQDLDATEVLIDKEAQLRQQSAFPISSDQPPDLRIATLGIAHLLSRRLLASTVDYGYKPLLALVWITGFVMLGTGLFYWGHVAGIIIPTDHGAYEAYSKTGQVPPDYQRFNSFVYALETFVPLIELHQASYWLPNPKPNDINRLYNPGRYLRWYLWIHILLGWLFTTMLVAGVAGIVRTG